MIDDNRRGRIFGLSGGSGARRMQVDDTEPRILGIPQSWVGFRRDPKRDIDTRWVRHPILWLRWRRQVRRLGPYAPRFDRFREERAERDA
jgi:hypothetical protein